MKKKLKKIWIFSFLLLFSHNLFSDQLELTAPEEVGLSSERLMLIKNIFENGIKNKKFPGAVIAISRKGKLAYFESFGWQNYSKQIPMKKNSIFRIYSMTKPIVSVGTMILNEKGKIYLSEPIHKYLPELKDLKVFEKGHNDNESLSQINLIPIKNPIKIHDLLRHTSGFTYGVFGSSPAKNQLKNSRIGVLNNLNISLKEYVNLLATFPLAYEPGTHWEYGRSIEVLGRLIETVSNKSLDKFLKQNIFEPLNMKDTGFYVNENNWNRIAEPYKDTGEPALINIKNNPVFLTGGHGLVSTVEDYMNFCVMLHNKGFFNKKIILGKKTIEYMVSDHLGKNINKKGPYYLPGEGYGFGLGFAVREQDGVSPWPGSKGEYFWAGYAGTYFWIDPKEELIVISMTQSVKNRMEYRMLLRNLVYQAILK